MEADKVVATYRLHMDKAQALTAEQLQRAQAIVSNYSDQIDTETHNMFVVAVLQAMATNFAAIQGR
jgi:hypothetical protein